MGTNSQLNPMLICIALLTIDKAGLQKAGSLMSKSDTRVVKEISLRQHEEETK